MNHITLDTQEIEFVFENCECIYIDEWAIKKLYFTTKGERYVWDEHSKSLMKSIEIDDFSITVDINDTKYFHHANRLIEKEQVKDDGSQCIDRLRYCDDITHLYINGICYHMPYDAVPVVYDKELPVPCYKNKNQVNNESVTLPGNHRMLTIKMKQGDTPKTGTYQAAETD